MGIKKKSEQATGADSFTFHQVRSLIPDKQELLAIEQNMRVADALKLMQKHGYSQLPVVAGSAVLGVFSYRSFSQKALTRQKSSKGEWLGELPVEDFLEELEFIHGSQDWNRIAEHLDRDDGFFVGNPDGLDGLVTTTDVLNYFRQIASPFIILAEIELSLRRVIERAIPREDWQSALESSLATAYPDKPVPQDLESMSFDNYAQIVSNGESWRYFEDFFDHGDVSRKQTTLKLQQLRDWRNIVFHHKRPLESWEMDTLVAHRAWLQRRMRAFDAKRPKKTAPRPPEKLTRGKMNREKLLADSNPGAAEFFDWLLTEAERRAAYFAIEWHPVSFSIRLRSEGRRLGFAYGYAPNKYEVYFQYLNLQPVILSRLRWRLLASGVFREVGKHTLRAEMSSEADTTRLKEASMDLMSGLLEGIELSRI